jgi:parallel beta-helix repeat protein
MIYNFINTKSGLKKALAFFSIVFLSLSVFGVPASPVRAATIDVCASGCSYTTIQDAVNASSNGDTINVEAGTYNLTSRIDVTKAVSIIGDITTPSNVVINAPVAGGTQHGQNSVFMITSSDVSIQGFKIQGALRTGVAQNAGIYVDDPRLVANPGLSNITISNNELTNNGWGIFVHNIKNSTISNNKIYGSLKTGDAGSEYDAGTGIVVFGRAEDSNHTYNLTIDNNQVYSNDTEGIRVDVSSSVGASDWINDLAITISDSTVYDNGRTILGVDKYIGIKSSGMSKGVTVSGNEIYGHAMSSYPTTTNQSSGIWISPNNDWNILNNNIHDNTNGVVFVYSTAVPGSGSHVISGNTIYNNVRGVSIDKGTEAVANNNSIYSNDSTAFSETPFDPYAVYNSGAGVFDATNNWWGTEVNAEIASTISGDVSYIPYYIDTGMNQLSNEVTYSDGVGTATSDTSNPQVVIEVVEGTQPAVTVTVTDGTLNPSIDVSDFLTDGTGEIPQITVISSLANVYIPAGTTVNSSDPSWNGIMEITVAPVVLPTTPGQINTLSMAIEIGFPDAKLSFDKGVRLVLPGQKDKKVGYSRTGVAFTEITTVCSTDNQTAGDALPVDGDCKINSGDDLVVWTKHFSTFATYSSTGVPNTGYKNQPAYINFGILIVGLLTVAGGLRFARNK